MIKVITKPIKRFIHLSHIDMDGYGSQVITNMAFQDNKEVEVHFFNTNYGDEITTRLREIEKLVSENEVEGTFLLITDINLTDAQCKVVEFIVSQNKIDVQLLDHHVNPEALKNVENYFEWYHLDNALSGTFLTGSWVYQVNRQVATDMLDFCRFVDAYDTWKKESKRLEFELGLIMNNVIFNGILGTLTQEVNNNERISYLTRCVKLIFGTAAQLWKSGVVSERISFFESICEEAIKTVFSNSIRKLDYPSSINIITAFQAKNLIETGRLGIVESKIANVKVLVLYKAGDVSALSSELFETFSVEYGFNAVINISASGGTGLRAMEGGDVSLLAREFFQGNGHKLASGGRLPIKLDPRDPKTYEEVLEIVKNIIKY
jgi:uncharacterized protein